MPNSCISCYWKERWNIYGRGGGWHNRLYNKCEAALTQVMGRKGGKVSAHARGLFGAGARDRYFLKGLWRKLTIGIGHIVLDARAVQLGDGVLS